MRPLPVPWLPVTVLRRDPEGHEELAALPGRVVVEGALAVTQCGEGWTVTHLPTLRKILGACCQDAALRGANAILPLADWRTVEYPAPADLGRAVQRALLSVAGASLSDLKLKFGLDWCWQCAADIRDGDRLGEWFYIDEEAAA